MNNYRLQQLVPVRPLQADLVAASLGVFQVRGALHLHSFPLHHAINEGTHRASSPQKPSISHPATVSRLALFVDICKALVHHAVRLHL